MKKLYFLGLVLSFLTIYVSAENAQQPPPGPYQDTCKECYIVNNAAGAELHCLCHKHQDEWKVNILPNVRSCQYPYVLINEDGKLKCALHEGMTFCKRCYIYGDTASCKLCQDGVAEKMHISQHISLPPAVTRVDEVIDNRLNQVFEVPPIPKP